MSSNPLREDAALRQLLKELPGISNAIEFKGWRKVFLEHFENYLDPQSTKKAGQVYRLFSHNVSKLIKILLKMKALLDSGALEPGQTTVGARRCISELSNQLSVTMTQLDSLVPGTSEIEQQFGYTKFNIGAVLVRDSFSEYQRLCMCTDSLLRYQALLQEVANRQVLEEMGLFGKKFQIFCDVMGDLDLYEVMMKSKQFAEERTLEEIARGANFFDDDTETTATPEPVKVTPPPAPPKPPKPEPVAPAVVLPEVEPTKSLPRTIDFYYPNASTQNDPGKLKQTDETSDDGDVKKPTRRNSKEVEDDDVKKPVRRNSKEVEDDADRKSPRRKSKETVDNPQDNTETKSPRRRSKEKVESVPDNADPKSPRRKLKATGENSEENVDLKSPRRKLKETVDNPQDHELNRPYMKLKKDEDTEELALQKGPRRSTKVQLEKLPEQESPQRKSKKLAPADDKDKNAEDKDKKKKKTPKKEIPEDDSSSSYSDIDHLENVIEEPVKKKEQEKPSSDPYKPTKRMSHDYYYNAPRKDPQPPSRKSEGKNKQEGKTNEPEESSKQEERPQRVRAKPSEGKGDEIKEQKRQSKRNEVDQPKTESTKNSSVAMQPPKDASTPSSREPVTRPRDVEVAAPRTTEAKKAPDAAPATTDDEDDEETAKEEAGLLSRLFGRSKRQEDDPEAPPSVEDDDDDDEEEEKPEKRRSTGFFGKLLRKGKETPASQSDQKEQEEEQQDRTGSTQEKESDVEEDDDEEKPERRRSSGFFGKLRRKAKEPSEQPDTNQDSEEVPSSVAKGGKEADSKKTSEEKESNTPASQKAHNDQKESKRQVNSQEPSQKVAEVKNADDPPLKEKEEADNVPERRQSTGFFGKLLRKGQAAESQSKDSPEQRPPEAQEEQKQKQPPEASRQVSNEIKWEPPEVHREASGNKQSQLVVTPSFRKSVAKENSEARGKPGQQSGSEQNQEQSQDEARSRGLDEANRPAQAGEKKPPAGFFTKIMQTPRSSDKPSTDKVDGSSNSHESHDNVDTTKKEVNKPSATSSQVEKPRKSDEPSATSSQVEKPRKSNEPSATSLQVEKPRKSDERKEEKPQLDREDRVQSPTKKPDVAAKSSVRSTPDKEQDQRLASPRKSVNAVADKRQYTEASSDEKADKAKTQAAVPNDQSKKTTPMQKTAKPLASDDDNKPMEEVTLRKSGENPRPVPLRNSSDNDKQDTTPFRESLKHVVAKRPYAARPITMRSVGDDEKESPHPQSSLKPVKDRPGDPRGVSSIDEDRAQKKVSPFRGLKPALGKSDIETKSPRRSSIAALERPDRTSGAKSPRRASIAAAERPDRITASTGLSSIPFDDDDNKRKSVRKSMSPVVAREPVAGKSDISRPGGVRGVSTSDDDRGQKTLSPRKYLQPATEKPYASRTGMPHGPPSDEDDKQRKPDSRLSGVQGVSAVPEHDNVQKDKTSTKSKPELSRPNSAVLSTSEEKVQKRGSLNDSASALKTTVSSDAYSYTPPVIAKEKVPEKKRELDRETARKCHMWYARMGQPTREDMKRRVDELPSSCGITVEDVELLPWVAGGSLLNIHKMNKLFLYDDTEFDPTKNTSNAVNDVKPNGGDNIVSTSEPASFTQTPPASPAEESSAITGNKDNTKKKKKKASEGDVSTKKSTNRESVVTSQPFKSVEISEEKQELPKKRELDEETARKCYMWYARMGQPTRDDMKRRVDELPSSCGVTQEDVELLPWISGGALLNVHKMNMLFLHDDPNYDPTKGSFHDIRMK